MPRRPAAWLLTPVLLGLGGCRSAESEAAAARPPTPVRVEVVASERFHPVFATPGIVEAASRLELGFRVGGLVERIYVEEGDRVESGDTIAGLDLADLERDVQTARARLASAEAGVGEADLAFRRQRRLLDLASTSQKSFDAARLQRERLRAELHEARLALSAARERLARGTLRAPIAGVIERRLVDEHEHAAALAPVVVLSALDTVVVRAAVPDDAVARVRPGAAATVRSAAWPGRRFAGRVRRIDVSADPATRAVPFEVELANEDLALRPEMGVDVEVELGPSVREPALPLAAVLRGVDGDPFCFVLAEDSNGPLAVRRTLDLGDVSGGRVAVRTGLEPGERVVTHGQHFLNEGDRVRVVAEEVP